MRERSKSKNPNSAAVKPSIRSKMKFNKDGPRCYTLENRPRLLSKRDSFRRSSVVKT